MLRKHTVRLVVLATFCFTLCVATTVADEKRRYISHPKSFERDGLGERGLPPKENLNPDPAITYGVVALATEEFKRYSTGKMEQLPGGEVMFVTDQYGSSTEEADDFHPSNVVKIVTNDFGKTWSKPEILIDRSKNDQTVQGPAVLRLRNGDYLLTATIIHRGFWKYKPEQWSTSVVKYRSTDGGETFEPDGHIWKEEPGARLQGGGVWTIQLKNGRVLFPYQYLNTPEKLWDIDMHCQASDDGGKTWFKAKGEVIFRRKRGAMEGCIAELSDETLLMTFRPHWSVGFVHMAKSLDHGDSWSKPQALTVPNPESPCRLATIPGTDDHLLMITNPTRGGLRNRLAMFISEDRGNTWRSVGNIGQGDDKKFEIGVQDVFFTKEGKVIVIWGWCTPLWNRDRCPLLSSSFDKEWLYRNE